MQNALSQVFPNQRQEDSAKYGLLWKDVLNKDGDGHHHMNLHFFPRVLEDNRLWFVHQQRWEKLVR